MHACDQQITYFEVSGDWDGEVSLLDDDDDDWSSFARLALGHCTLKQHYDIIYI